MNRIIFTVSILCLFTASSCYKDFGGSTANNPWEQIDFTTIGAIRTMHAAPVEVLAVNDLEFFRINSDNEVIEERPIGLAADYFGRPAVGDWVFARFIEKNTKNVAELHLTNNANEIFDLIVNDIQVPAGTTISLEGTAAKNVGVFNDDSSQLAFAVELNRTEGSNFGIVIVDIVLSGNKEEFVSVEVKLVDIPEMRSNAQRMSSISFVGGAYYVTSKDGGFRISANGNYSQVVSGWTLDTFDKEGSIYMTSFNDFDFFQSENNGVTFERTGTTSPAKYVFKADDQYFSHENRGFEFELLSDDFEDLRDIIYNEAIENKSDGDAFWNMIYMGGRYYINIQGEIWFVEDIKLVEE